MREKYFPHQNTRAVPTHNSWPRIESQAKISLYGSRSSELAQPPTMLCHSGLFLFPLLNLTSDLHYFFFPVNHAKTCYSRPLWMDLFHSAFFFFVFTKRPGHTHSQHVIWSVFRRVISFLFIPPPHPSFRLACVDSNSCPKKSSTVCIVSFYRLIPFPVTFPTKVQWPLTWILLSLFSSFSSFFLVHWIRF